MQVDNLRDVDVKALEATIGEQQKENPAIAYQVFSMEEKLQKVADGIAVKSDDWKDTDKPMRQQLDEMAEMICEIQATLASIFGDHVLIKGRWQNLTDLDKVEGT